MSMDVLRSKKEIAEARKLLKRIGADSADPAFIALMKRNRLWPGTPRGDQVKSWDIWKTVSFLHQNLSSDAPILDLGAYACEVLPALHNLGFTSLTGIDLNPALSAMPHQNAIHYVIGNFLETSISDGSFDAITAISVIEHGYQPERLMGEISRLLKNGGYFIASVDYWPSKIDTSGITVFGLDWRIFSHEDMDDLFACAAEHGLYPVGEMHFDAGDALIPWQSRDYTFAWIALRKG